MSFDFRTFILGTHFVEMPSKLLDHYETTTEFIERFVDYVEGLDDDFDVLIRISPVGRMFKDELEPYANRLIRHIHSCEVGSFKMQAALAAVFHTRAGARYFEDLPMAARVRCSAPWVYPMVDLAELGDEFGAFSIGALLLSTSTQDRIDLVRLLEAMRARRGAGASIYRSCKFSTDLQNEIRKSLPDLARDLQDFHNDFAH